MGKMKLLLVVLVLVISVHSGLSRHHNPRRRINETPKQTDTFEYFTKHDVINIPIMVHIDKALTHDLSKEYKSRSREKVKHLFKSILQNVQTMFRRPSLNQTIIFELIDVKFLKNATKKFIMDENVSSYLKSYCQWQSEKKEEKRRWWYSVLFTGLDVFYYGKDRREVRSSTGRSYMNGICSSSRSCTILEWKRTNNIHQKLTHEIGHSLGISHDGAPDNQCRGDYHIMSARYTRHIPAKTWSSCSKRDLQRFLASGFSWCLRSQSRNRLQRNRL